jgi:hypothetical protein
MEPRVEINFIIAKEDAPFSPGKNGASSFFLPFSSSTAALPA